LPIKIQLDTIEPVDEHHTPPPAPCDAPLVKVNPTRLAPPLKYTQLTAPLPFVVPGTWYPWIVVTPGPFTLCTVIGKVTATRFVADPRINRPPVLYTPLETKMVPLMYPTSTAS